MTDLQEETTVISEMPPDLNRMPNLEIRASHKLGEILIAQGACSEEELEAALQVQIEDKPDQRIGQILIGQKAVEELHVLKALAAQCEIELIETVRIDEVPDELIKDVPISFAKANTVLPIARDDFGITAVINDPLNSLALDDLGVLLGDRVTPLLASSEIITQAINKVYDRATGLAHEAVQELQNDDDAEDDLDAIDLIDEATGDDAPIIKFVNALLRDAVKDRVSDIHVECFEKSVVVRTRIDGILYKKVEAPKQAQAPVIARIKIMAGLNIAEKRLPQDGRIRRKIAGKDIDVRVSTVPTAYGERVVMRILDRSSVLLSLEDLGFEKTQYENMTNLIERPHGILLVSGPTGSGKTTTLYAALSKINTPDINILTVEDPVEYQLPGIGQMQVQSKIDLTFASGLRAFLRQDPDVIMVGEIRDKETAEIAIQASLTGHLVLSTVHTNDAAGATTRLADMGIEPFLVASSLCGILAQRLIRTLCKHCKKPYHPTAEQAAKINLEVTPDMVFYQEVGCDKCLNTGYSGRRGIYELLVVSDNVRRLVLQSADAGAVKRAAMEEGMTTLLDDGARKVLGGVTSPEEVLRVAAEEDQIAEV
ncbi:MAG: type II secretion system ATPase GspE [Myxococcota bacterium]|nr:type II secretion system ATPase GspE [Myxococcota bacterium]